MMYLWMSSWSDLQLKVRCRVIWVRFIKESFEMDQFSIEKNDNNPLDLLNKYVAACVSTH